MKRGRLPGLAVDGSRPASPRSAPPTSRRRGRANRRPSRAAGLPYWVHYRPHVIPGMAAPVFNLSGIRASTASEAAAALRAAVRELLRLATGFPLEHWLQRAGDRDAG